MAALTFSDFDYYASSAAIEAINDTETVVEGTGSLLIARVSGTSTEQLTYAPKTPAQVQGTTFGAMRLLMSIEELHSPSQATGLLCMQSQRDLTATGEAYGLRWAPVSGRLSIIKILDGLVNAGDITELAFVTGITGSLRSVQITWRVAADTASIRFTVTTGTALDFSDLALAFSVTDNDSPLITTVTEGGFYNDGGAGEGFMVRYDQLGLRGVFA